MSDKTYVFDSGAGNLSAMLPSLLQSKGIDPAYLMGIMNNGGGNGFWGGNGFQDILALIVVAAIFGNGNFGFGNNGNNANSQLLTSLLERNGVDIASLASAVNCSSDRISDAIGQVSTQICNLGTQVGQSTNQIITSLMQGNNALASQLASCCCSIEKGILESNYLTEKGFCNTNQILSQGFSSVAYAQKDQTCALENAIKDSTAQILAGQAAIEKRELQREIDTLREQKETYKIGNLINGAIAPLAAEVAGIKCKLPTTETVNVSPEYVPINRGINIGYAPYACGGFNTFGAGWGNGCNNFQWG
jgi:hypothetical protein